MTQQEMKDLIRKVGDGTGLSNNELIYPEELALAFRNRGLPLEGIRYPVTPTGMHYLLTHFDIPDVDASTWRLKVNGLVSNKTSLSLEDLKSLPKVSLPVTMECAGNGRALMAPRPISQPWMVEAIGTAEWTGTPLAPILDEAGLRPESSEIVFTGADRGVQDNNVHLYERSLTVAEATREEVLLAYAMNGQPLEPQHGFPLRLIVPGWYGMTSVKWLTSIEAIDHEFGGFQQAEAYRYQTESGEPGEPVTLIRPRALMAPPGIPDFLTRTRLLEAGRVTLSGRAWAGREQVTGVEVSTDGGKSWSEAVLEAPVGVFAWRGWSFEWDAKSGSYELSVRASCATGASQPDKMWNLQGMGNNACQRIEVIVEERLA